MNHKTLLSTLALATLVAGTAKANEDITSPFYLPSDLETLSETSVKYERTNIDDGGAKEDFILRETALVGFGIENAVMVSVGNRFNFKYLTNEDYNNDLNLDYELGLKKNWRSENGWVMQTGASYYTYNPRSWYGRSGGQRKRFAKNTEIHVGIKNLTARLSWVRNLRTA